MKLDTYIDNINNSLRIIDEELNEYTEQVKGRLPQELYDNLKGFYHCIEKKSDKYCLHLDIVFNNKDNKIFDYYSRLDLMDIMIEICGVDLCIEDVKDGVYSELIISLY